MTEVLISSSALILAVCLLRFLLQNRISMKIRYGLWGLAALRLILPMFYPLQKLTDVFRSRFSVMNAAQTVRQNMIAQTDLKYLADNVATGHVYHFDAADGAVTLAQRAAGIDWQLWIMVVWVVGALVLGAWMTVVNIRFYRMLVSKRKIFHGKTPGFVTERIYTVEGMVSPCYFGLGTDEAIYLPLSIEGDEEKLRHALAHETCHAAHGDRFWGILRCVLLCYYWVNPLVWAAAILSKRDCELACDEAAVRLLGEEERYAYGRTLVSLIAQNGDRKSLFSAATTMTGGKHTVRERIHVLARHPRTTRLMAGVVVLMVAVLGACTFTGNLEETSSGEKQDAVAGSLLEQPGDEAAGESRPPVDSESRLLEETAGELPRVPVGEGDMLALIKTELWGNYYQLTMERRDAGTGEALPISYDNGGTVQVTAYEDREGTKLSGDGKPDQGYGYAQSGTEVFVISFWNTEQAGSIRISITQDGKSVDYLFVTKDRELLKAYTSSQVIHGPDDTQASLASAQLYPNAVWLRLLGSDEQEAADLGDNHRILLTLDRAEDKENMIDPQVQSRSGRVIDVLYCFDEDLFPEAAVEDIAVMEESGARGVATRLDDSQTSLAVYETARKFCEAYMAGDIKNAARYSSFPERELSDSVPMDDSKPADLTIRWDPQLKEVYAEAVYRFYAKGEEDSYTYLNLELKKAYGEWKVTWKGFEK